MSYAVSSSRLDFLKNSAQALHADSPSTAAYLLATHSQLIIDQGKALTPNQTRQFCPACGSIRLPGWTSTVFTTQKKRKKDRRSGKTADATEPSSRSPGSRIVYRCLRCDRHVIQPLQKPTRFTNKQPQNTVTSSSISQTTLSPTPASPIAPPAVQSSLSNLTDEKKRSENASSKRRAKSRKNQGLLAMLAANKQESRSHTPSASLDLLDFLQP
ncbi:hypothetical protein VTO42DRAFT_2924 [Malbranchea cinnamomea]